MMTSNLVMQRIRNRIIELLQWIVDCESSAPKVGFGEFINSWEDWVPSPLPDGYFPEPVFTPQEALIIVKVNYAINEFNEVTPKYIEDSAIHLMEWAEVVAAAKSALFLMLERGSFQLE